MLSIVICLHFLVWAICFIVYFRSKSFSVFHPLTIYQLFHFVVFVLRPILLHFAGFEAVITSAQYRPSDSDFIKTMVAIDIGLIVFQTTMLRVTQRYRPSPVRQIGVAEKTYPAFIATCVVLFPLVIIALVSGSRGGGGTRDEFTGVFIQTSTTGYITDAPAMLVTLLIICTVIHKFKAWSYLPVCVYLAYHLYFAVNRWPLAVIGISSVLNIAYFQGTRRALKVAVMGVALLLPLFYFKGVDRELFLNLSRGEISEALMERTKTGATSQERFDVMDYAQYDMMSIFVSVYPEVSGGYTYFTQWLQLFTEPIPRVLWPNKPIGSPVKLNEFYMLDVANVIGFSATMMGWGWMSFGFFGVVVQTFVSAWIIGKLYVWFCKNGSNYVVAVTYILVNSVLFQYYRDGDISIFKFLFFLGLPLMLWMLFSRMAGAKSIPLRNLGKRPNHGARRFQETR